MNDRYAYRSKYLTVENSKASNHYGIALKSANDDGAGCRLIVWGPTKWITLKLPTILLPYKEKVQATYWDENDIKRMGQDWYWRIDTREFSISYLGESNSVHLRYGRQTFDSSTTKSKCWFVPWLEYRFVRFSLFDDLGRHFWTQLMADRRGFAGYDEQSKQTDACPKVIFDFDDFDGQRIRATTHIEEREWERGTGWFKWLTMFYEPKVRRSLDIRFSKEVGPKKGSWKGGTLGHGIDVREGELHYGAFRRYAKKYNLTNVSEVS